MSVNTPARFGNGYMFLVDGPGIDEPHVLCDERTLDELLPAGQPVSALRFRGLEVDGEISGKPAKVLVGAGFFVIGPGVVVRYHDAFAGPKGPGDDEDDDEDDDGDEEEAPDSGPRVVKVTGFPSLGGR